MLDRDPLERFREQLEAACGNMGVQRKPRTNR